MTETAKPGYYVYQPNPPQKDGRMYAVGGLPIGTSCKGLTRDEAEAIVSALSRESVKRGEMLGDGQSAAETMTAIFQWARPLTMHERDAMRSAIIRLGGGILSESEDARR